MDHDLIYTKTASGEGAMLQRTRVMQRNVRMVLILVDSQSSVADLCLKTGNPQLTEDALSELEKGGFIAPLVDPDSMWAAGRRVAEEVRAAVKSGKRIQISSPRSRQATESLVSDAPISASVMIKTAVPDDSSLTTNSLASAHSGRDFVGSTSPVFAEARAKNLSEDQAKGGAKPSFVERIKAYFVKQKLKINHSEPVFVESLRPVLWCGDRRHEDGEIPTGGRVTALASGSVVKGEEFAFLKPVRRDQGTSIGWPVIVVLSIAAAIGLVFVVVLLFPYDNYLSDVEMAFANASGRKVKVGAMRINVYPKPVLLLDNVRIGAGKDEIHVAEMRLLPAIGTLTAAKKVFREVVLSGVSFSLEMIAGLPSIFVALSSSTARVGVDHLGLEKVAISFSELGFSGMEGEARLSADGLFQSLFLRSADRSLSIVATPQEKNGLDVLLEGADWRPAPGSPFVFDSISLKGGFDNKVFTISSMELRIFEGLVEGVAVLRADTMPSIVGDVSFKRVNAARFGGALGLGQQFGGEIAGKIVFSTKAESWESIFSSIDAGGEFVIHRGSIRGIDLAEAARSVSNEPIQGGATAFENLSGAIKLTPARYQFLGLVLNSGLMQSTGAVDVSKSLMVSGKMDLKIRGTVNQTRVPISISGPLKFPTVQAAGRGG